MQLQTWHMLATALPAIAPGLGAQTSAHSMNPGHSAQTIRHSLHLAEAVLCLNPPMTTGLAVEQGVPWRVGCLLFAVKVHQLPGCASLLLVLSSGELLAGWRLSQSWKARATSCGYACGTR